MEWLTKLLLSLVYLVILPVGLVRRVLGCDAMQLRPPPPGVSCWLVRGGPPAAQSYFSEVSTVEGRPTVHQGTDLMTHRGISRWFTPLLLLVARWHAPSREATGEKFLAGADREQAIPDEVYTLW